MFLTFKNIIKYNDLQKVAMPVPLMQEFVSYIGKERLPYFNKSTKDFIEQNMSKYRHTGNDLYLLQGYVIEEYVSGILQNIPYYVSFFNKYLPPNLKLRIKSHSYLKNISNVLNTIDVNYEWLANKEYEKLINFLDLHSIYRGKYSFKIDFTNEEDKKNFINNIRNKVNETLPNDKISINWSNDYVRGNDYLIIEPKFSDLFQDITWNCAYSGWDIGHLYHVIEQDFKKEKENKKVNVWNIINISSNKVLNKLLIIKNIIEDYRNTIFSSLKFSNIIDEIRYEVVPASEFNELSNLPWVSRSNIYLDYPSDTEGIVAKYKGKIIGVMGFQVLDVKYKGLPVIGHTIVLVNTRYANKGIGKKLQEAFISYLNGLFGVDNYYIVSGALTPKGQKMLDYRKSLMFDPEKLIVDEPGIDPEIALEHHVMDKEEDFNKVITSLKFSNIINIFKEEYPKRSIKLSYSSEIQEIDKYLKKKNSFAGLKFSDYHRVFDSDMEIEASLKTSVKKKIIDWSKLRLVFKEDKEHNEEYIQAIYNGKVIGNLYFEIFRRKVNILSTRVDIEYSNQGLGKFMQEALVSYLNGKFGIGNYSVSTEVISPEGYAMARERSRLMFNPEKNKINWSDIEEAVDLDENYDINIAVKYLKEHDIPVDDTGGYITVPTNYIDEANALIKKLLRKKSDVSRLSFTDITKVSSLKFSDVRDIKPHPSVEEAFKDSVVRYEDGSLKPVFHGTPFIFEEFNPRKTKEIGFHFGPVEQANVILKRREQWANEPLAIKFIENVPVYYDDNYNKKIEYAANIHPLFLNIKNPLYLPDVGTWEISEIMDALVKRKILKYIPGEEDEYGYEINSKYVDRYGNIVPYPRNNRELKLLLKRFGYDGIAYKNKYERGTRGKIDWTYIPFSIDQIQPAFLPLKVKSTSIKFSNILNSLPKLLPEPLVSLLHALYCVESLLPLYESVFPNDETVKNVIRSVYKWLNNPTKDNYNDAILQGELALERSHQIRNSNTCYAIANAAGYLGISVSNYGDTCRVDQSRKYALIANENLDYDGLKLKAKRNAFQYLTPKLLKIYNDIGKFANILNVFPSEVPTEMIVDSLWLLYCSEELIPIYENKSFVKKDFNIRQVLKIAKKYIFERTSSNLELLKNAYNDLIILKNRVNSDALRFGGKYDMLKYCIYAITNSILYIINGDYEDKIDALTYINFLKQQFGISIDVESLKLKAESDAWYILNKQLKK